MATGVRSDAQVEFLMGHGIDLPQGDHLGAPMPAAEVTRLLAGYGAATGPGRGEDPC